MNNSKAIKVKHLNKKTSSQARSCSITLQTHHLVEEKFIFNQLKDAEVMCKALHVIFFKMFLLNMMHFLALVEKDALIRNKNI